MESFEKLKYPLTFTEDRCEVLLGVEENNVDLETVKEFAKEHNLLPKEEFHVTLVGGKASLLIKEHLASLSEEEGLELRTKIENLMNSFGWTPQFKKEFYYLKRNYDEVSQNDPSITIPETRETIIELVDIPQLNNLHLDLQELVGIQLGIKALPHVTIYSNSTREDKKQRGIGIYSDADLEVSNAIKISV